MFKRIQTTLARKDMLTRQEFQRVFYAFGSNRFAPQPPSVSTKDFFQISKQIQSEVKGPDDIFGKSLTAAVFKIAAVIIASFEDEFKAVPSVRELCQELRTQFSENKVTYRSFTRCIFQLGEAAEAHLVSLLPKRQLETNLLRKFSDPKALIFRARYHWDTVDEHCKRFPSICFLPVYAYNGLFTDLSLIWQPIVEMEIIGSDRKPEIKMVWPFALSSEFSEIHGCVASPFTAGSHDRSHLLDDVMTDLKKFIEKKKIPELKQFLAAIKECVKVSRSTKERDLLSKLLAVGLHDGSLFSFFNELTQKEGEQYNWLAWQVINEFPSERKNGQMIEKLCAEIRENYLKLSPPKKAAAKKEKQLSVKVLEKLLQMAEAYAPSSEEGREKLWASKEIRSTLSQCLRNPELKERALKLVPARITERYPERYQEQPL